MAPGRGATIHDGAKQQKQQQRKKRARPFQSLILYAGYPPLSGVTFTPLIPALDHEPITTLDSAISEKTAPSMIT